MDDKEYAWEERAVVDYLRQVPRAKLPRIQVIYAVARKSRCSVPRVMRAVSRLSRLRAVLVWTENRQRFIKLGGTLSSVQRDS